MPEARRPLNQDRQCRTVTFLPVMPRQARVVVGHGDDEGVKYGLAFGLWTRSLVAELIERKFAIRLGVTAVRELLAKLGL